MVFKGGIGLFTLLFIIGFVSATITNTASTYCDAGSSIEVYASAQIGEEINFIIIDAYKNGEPFCDAGWAQENIPSSALCRGMNDYNEWVDITANLSLSGLYLEVAFNGERKCSSSVPLSLPLEVCGNGLKETDEECDDGNLINEDGCSSECTLEVSAPLCGNGVKETDEECDDGNLINGDGCSSTCNLEVPGTVCGNGIVESPPEECDDENIIGGDGCSADCLVEPPYICSGSPSICTAATWRDLSDEEITEFYALLGQEEEILMVIESERILAGVTSATFTVYEKNEIWFDREISSERGDAIMNRRMNGIFSVDDFGLDEGTYTLYFEVSVNDGEFDATSEELTLILSEEICEELPCSAYGINECEDAPIKCTDFTVDDCRQSTGEICDLGDFFCNYVRTCKCKWDESQGICIEEIGKSLNASCMGSDECPASLGACSLLQQLVDPLDNCKEDGFLKYKWSGTWDWKENSYKNKIDDKVILGEDEKWHYPNSAYEPCIDGDSRAIPCPSMIALPFFGYLELLVTLILIALVYYFIFVFRNKGKKTKGKRKR